MQNTLLCGIVFSQHIDFEYSNNYCNDLIEIMSLSVGKIHPFTYISIIEKGGIPTGLGIFTILENKTKGRPTQC